MRGKKYIRNQIVDSFFETALCVRVCCGGYVRGQQWLHRVCGLTDVGIRLQRTPSLAGIGGRSAVCNHLLLPD